MVHGEPKSPKAADLEVKERSLEVEGSIRCTCSYTLGTQHLPGRRRAFFKYLTARDLRSAGRSSSKGVSFLVAERCVPFSQLWSPSGSGGCDTRPLILIPSRQIIPYTV